MDYFKKKSVSIIEINSGMLFAYEKWLQIDCTMTRINQLGNEAETIAQHKGHAKQAEKYRFFHDMRFKLMIRNIDTIIFNNLLA